MVVLAVIMVIVVDLAVAVVNVVVSWVSVVRGYLDRAMREVMLKPHHRTTQVVAVEQELKVQVQQA